MAGRASPDPPDRHLKIVGGEKERVGLWMLERLPEITALPGGYEAIGVERAGRLIGGCLFTEYVPYKGGGTITIWAAGERGWVSRRVIQTMLGYPFNQLGCHRITALAAKDNKPSRKLLEDLGFRFEGVARLGFGPRRHACIYGLLKIEQGWV